LGFVTLAITTLAAAFIPECPFYSPFSALIQFVANCPWIIMEELLGRRIWKEKDNQRQELLWLGFLILSCLGIGSGIAYGTLKYSFNILPLVFIPLTITFAFGMKEIKNIRKPQKYRLPYFALGGFVIIGSIMSAAGYFTGSQNIFIILYCVGMSILFIVGLVARGLAKSTEKTKDIDAIAWFLNSLSEPSKIVLYLKRIGQSTTDSDTAQGNGYKARLLNSLMPLLSSLITSRRTKILSDKNNLKDLETYVSCLAQLSDFKEDRWSWKFWKLETLKMLLHLREDAKTLPILENSLREKLEEFQNSPSADLKEAANAVLRRYQVHEHGNELQLQPLESEVSGDTSSMNTLTEPEHWHTYEARSQYRRKTQGGYYDHVVNPV
jgi:hypothetical protein